MAKRRTRQHATVAGSGYEEEILRSLRRIIRAVDLYSRRLMAAHGLSGPQLLCLTQLAKGEMRSGALAPALSLSPATVTGIPARPAARGPIGPRRQRRDTRRVAARLT